MAKAVWKYDITLSTPMSGDATEIRMPRGAKILSVQEQHHRIRLWAEVDAAATFADTVPRRFMVFGTGQDLPENARNHVGTVVMGDGTFVWHVYELI